MDVFDKCVYKGRKGPILPRNPRPGVLKKGMSRSGVYFGLGKIHRQMMEKAIESGNRKAGSLSAVYMASTLQTLVSVILDAAGKKAKEEGCRIKARHIDMAIKEDPELTLVMQGNASGAGVQPNLPSGSRTDESEAGPSNPNMDLSDGLKSDKDSSDECSTSDED